MDLRTNESKPGNEHPFEALEVLCVVYSVIRLWGLEHQWSYEEEAWGGRDVVHKKDVKNTMGGEKNEWGSFGNGWYGESTDDHHKKETAWISRPCY